MAENKMKEVAKLLGVELEEEFKIKGFINKCKLSTYGLMCWSDTSQDWVLSSAIGELLNGLDEIVKLYEPQKPILTDKEKEYLSLVIKPFRDRVSSISKDGPLISKDGPLEYITILLDGDDFAILPNFEEGTMYKGMTLDEKYTLEEVEL